MAEIIDLTASPPPEIIEISSDQGDTSPGRPNRTQENKKRKKKKEKTSNGLTSDGGIGSSAQPSRAHSPEIVIEHRDRNESTPYPESAPQALEPISSSIADEPELFFLDGTAAPIVVEEISPAPDPAESNGDGNKLLLPSHVAILRDDGRIPAEVIPPPNLCLDDEEYIEYLDYEDRKAPGLVRYFEVTEAETNQQSRPSIFKCKNCGAEGDHKTYECPIQICLTCGARDEHSTRGCPIGKTCYTCGMKGHINKTCPNRFSACMASSDFHGICRRCRSTEHNMNECPTLWRIYQYVNDEERTVIMQSREEKKQLGRGEGGEGYIGEVWCYNCANTGHLGDDCDELPHSATFPTENSAFSFHNVKSSPFYNPAAEPVPIKRGSRERESKIDRTRLPDDWDAGAPVDVGKRGKHKDKERLEKRFREQEDEGEDWFNDIRNRKRRGEEQQAPSGPRGKTFKFGLFKDGGYEPSSPPPSLATSGSGSSLLARIGNARGDRPRGKGGRGRERQEPSYQSENSIRIRGAATDQRDQDSRYASSRKADVERGEDQWDRDRPGHRGSRRSHGPRYRGGYDR